MLEIVKLHFSVQAVQLKASFWYHVDWSQGKTPKYSNWMHTYFNGCNSQYGDSTSPPPTQVSPSATASVSVPHAEKTHKWTDLFMRSGFICSWIMLVSGFLFCVFSDWEWTPSSVKIEVALWCVADRLQHLLFWITDEKKTPNRNNTSLDSARTYKGCNAKTNLLSTGKGQQVSNWISQCGSDWMVARTLCSFPVHVMG